MVSATLGIETTITGFLYLATVLFLFVPHDAAVIGCDLRASKDLLPFLAVAIVGASYVVGTITSHFLAVASRCFICILRERWAQKLRDWFGSGRGGDSSDLALVWQFGSERTQKEIDYQFGLLMFLRSLPVPILFAAIEWCVCEGRIEGWYSCRAILAYFVSLVFLLASLCAWKRQASHYRSCQAAAMSLVQANLPR
jgi:hypothetical protein